MACRIVKVRMKVYARVCKGMHEHQGICRIVKVNEGVCKGMKGYA